MSLETRHLFARFTCGQWPDRSHCELEAESAAWLVCQRTGVLPRSREYLSAYATDERLAEISMYAILEAANRIEARGA